MDIIIFLRCICFTLPFFVVAASSPITSTTWVRTTAKDISWRSLTSDSTGKYLFAFSYSGGDNDANFYKSNDFGKTWAPTTTFFSGLVDMCVSSASGKYLVALHTFGDFYVSSDFGTSWSVVQRSDDIYWEDFAFDSSGSMIVAVGNLDIFDDDSDTGVIYISTDHGVNWKRSDKLSAYILEAVTVSSSGQNVIIATWDGLFRSTDYGGSWTHVTIPNFDYNFDLFYDVAGSSSGQYVVALSKSWDDSSASFFLSSNYGVHWKKVMSVSCENIIVSDSGQVMAVSTDDNEILVSSDFGATWVNSNAPDDLEWHGLVVDSTGQYFTAAQNEDAYDEKGSIYQLFNPLPTPSPTAQPTMAPTPAQIYQTSVQQTLNGVSQSQYVANLTNNNLALCTAVAHAIDGAPEDCEVTSVEPKAPSSSTAEEAALRRRLSTTNGVDIGYTIIFNSVALGFPGSPTDALEHITMDLNTSVTSGNFSRVLKKYALEHNIGALSDVTTTAVTVSMIFTDVGTIVPPGGKDSSSNDENTNIIIGVVVGVCGALLILALVVYYGFGWSSSAQTKVHNHEGKDGLDTANQNNKETKKPESGDNAVVAAEASTENV